jgi:hypothetical protein
MNVVRDTLGTGIYFMVYESGKQLGTAFGGDNPNSNKLSVVASGGLCGLVSWAMICTSAYNLCLSGVADQGQIPSIQPRAYTSEMLSCAQKERQSKPRLRLSSSSVTCIEVSGSL